VTFAYTVTKRMIVGDSVVAYGTYTNGVSDTGGDINTQMDVCDYIKLSDSGSSAVAACAVANETFPCAGHAVTIVTAANQDGQWYAVGRGVGY